MFYSHAPDNRTFLLISMPRTALLLLALLSAHGLEESIAADGSVAGLDSSSFLQKPAQGKDNGTALGPAPHIIGLRRESVPIYRRGKIASFKTSYSGVLSVGYPPQDFRVVFDTGSAHIILPASECQSEACLANNRRHYDQKESTTSLPINADGSIVHEGDMGEQVTIGFGTGEITGEFAKDTVCFGKGQTKDELRSLKEEQRRQEEIAALIKQESLLLHDYEADHEAEAHEVDRASDGTEVVADHSPMCMEMSIIVAVEMSTVPFKTFKFDGILGLSLDGLAMNKNFSTFDMLVRNGLASRPHFGVFLTDSEDLEPSEVAFGGADPQRMLEPISWSQAQVYRPDLGYWVVPILSVKVDGLELDMCKDGTCRGVVDTGTSHLGIPGPHDKELGKMLKVDAGDLLDCRLAQSPKLEIELPGKTIELFASSYMRRLPLREGVSVSSEKGVTLDENDKKKGKRKEEARFERPGYVKLEMGASREEMKCMRPDLAVQCPPEAANRRDDIYGDQFHVYTRGEEICVNRTDLPGGWGMNLAFYCPEPYVAEKEGTAEAGVESIFLGDLDTDTERCYNTFAELDCQSTDEFAVRKEDRLKVCVTRKHTNLVKESDVMRCKLLVDSALAGLQEVVIGSQTAGEMQKCVMPEVPVTCEPESGNRRKDNFPDTFEIFEENNQICARRTDGGEANWALNLIIHCKPKLEADLPRNVDREEVHLQQGENPAKEENNQEQKEEVPEEPQQVTRHCSPRLMAVNLPAPLGPKLFILGEPVLHRYYTVYDWEEKRVGFSLANTQRNTMDLSQLGRGTLPKEVDMLLMQRHMQVKSPKLL